MEAGDSSKQVNGIMSVVANGALAKVDQVHDPRDMVSVETHPLWVQVQVQEQK